MLRTNGLPGLAAILLCAACSTSDAELAGGQERNAISESPYCGFGCDIRAFQSPAPPRAAEFVSGITMPLPPPQVGPSLASDGFDLAAAPSAASLVTGVNLPLPPPAVGQPLASDGFDSPAPPPAASYVTAPPVPLAAPAAYPAFQEGGYEMTPPPPASSLLSNPASFSPPPVAPPLGNLSCIPEWPANAPQAACPAPARSPAGAAPAAVRPPASAPAAAVPMPTAPAPAPSAPAASVPPAAVPVAPAVRPPAQAAVPTAPAAQTPAQAAVPPPAPQAPRAAAGQEAALPLSTVPLLVVDTRNGGNAELERMFRSVTTQTMPNAGFRPVQVRGGGAYAVTVRVTRVGPADRAGETSAVWELTDPQGHVVDAFRQQLMLFPGVYDPKVVPAISGLVEEALARFSNAIRNRG